MKPISKPLNYALLAVGIGVSMYFMQTNSGPYRWLTGLERARLGWWSSELTYVAIALAIWLPLRFIASLRNDEPAAQQGDPSRFTESAARSALVASGVFGVMLAIGGYLWWMADQAGPLRKVQSVDFATLQSPAYVELDGTPAGRTVQLNKAGGESTLYIPLAAAIVEVDPAKAQFVDGHIHAKGIARRGVLDGQVREAFRETLGDDPWVIQTGNDPQTDRWLALGSAAFGAILCAGVYVLRRRACATNASLR